MRLGRPGLRDPTAVPVALLGLGFAGARLHLPALRRLSVPVVLAADPDLSTHGVIGEAGASRDWRDALRSPARAVVVATPPESHGELALAALQAGKHVYIEKPMATTAGGAAELQRVAASADRVVQIGFAYRFHPLWRQVRGLLARGWLAPPLRFEASFITDRAGSGWGEPVFDLACHHVDLASWLLDRAPASVRLGPDELEVGWEDGSVLVGGYGVGTPADRVRVSAGRRSVLVDRLQGWRLRGSLPPGFRVPPASLAVTRTIRRGWDRSFEYALAAFLTAVTAHDTGDSGARARSDGAGPAAGRVGVEVAQAMLRSRASGRTEPVRMP